MVHHSCNNCILITSTKVLIVVYLLIQDLQHISRLTSCEGRVLKHVDLGSAPLIGKGHNSCYSIYIKHICVSNRCFGTMMYLFYVHVY